MPNRFDFGGVDLTAGESPSSSPQSAETPFCVAIFGDFSGRASRGLKDAKTLGERRPILVDRDNFDEVLAGLKVELHFATEQGDPIALRFSGLDDFHPDRLFEHSVFSRLRELRAKLQNPATFGDVARDAGLLVQSSQSPGRTAEDSTVLAPRPLRLATGSLLDEMIEQTEARGVVEQATRKADEVSDFARQLAARYSVAAPDPRQAEIVGAVDQAVGDAMRTVLHHPDFQALEAIWRATFFLVRQIETGPLLKIYLFDISKAELAADLKSSADVQRTGVFRLLVEKGMQMPGADPWALVIGNYSFGPEGDDMELLRIMAKIAKRARAPFLAGADPTLLGAESITGLAHPRDWNRVNANGWYELRSQPEADALALALPRFLARLPYGEKTSPVESFNFEEFQGSPSHEGYLWTNPAFAVGLLIAESFSQLGWQMRLGSVAQLDKLPLHVYQADGESVSKPCAEVLLTEDAVEGILEAGIIPLVSFKGRDSVRIGRFQSIARPQGGLSGRWSS